MKWFSIIWILGNVIFLSYTTYKMGRTSGFSRAFDVVMKEWKADTTSEMFTLDPRKAAMKSTVYDSLVTKMMDLFNEPFFHWKKK